MAKLNAVESDLEKVKDRLRKILSEDELKEVEVLFEASEIGMRSFRVLFAIRPLIVSVFDSLVKKLDAKRFMMESMLRDIDDILAYWVVDDEQETESRSEQEEGSVSKK